MGLLFFVYDFSHISNLRPGKEQYFINSVQKCQDIMNKISIQYRWFNIYSIRQHFLQHLFSKYIRIVSFCSPYFLLSIFIFILRNIVYTFCEEPHLINNLPKSILCVSFTVEKRNLKISPQLVNILGLYHLSP